MFAARQTFWGHPAKAVMRKTCALAVHTTRAAFLPATTPTIELIPDGSRYGTTSYELFGIFSPHVRIGDAAGVAAMLTPMPMGATQNVLWKLWIIAGFLFLAANFN